MKFFTREVKMGLTAAVAVVIIYLGIIFLKGVKLKSTHNLYYIEMSDVNGLAPAAEVLANGVNVGLVKQLNYDQQRQLVCFSVELNEGFTVPQGTKATLTKDMLGAPKVKMLLGSDPSRLMAQGDTIEGFPMVDVLADAGSLVPSVELLLPKIDSILTALNQIVANPAINNSLNNVEYVTRNLRVTTDQLNRLLNKDVPQLMANVNAISTNLQQTTEQLKQADFVGIANNANSTITSLQLFTNRLNDSGSTLGKLTNDASAYNHLDSTLLNASRLLEDLRENPKRYVHFSMFGKK